MLAEREVVRLARDKIGGENQAKLGKTRQNQSKPSKTDENSQPPYFRPAF